MDYSGTLVITEISASRIKGTFAFAALPVALGGATGLRNVTEGVFDLPLAGPYTPPGDHEGSSIVYDTSGVQAVVAATVIGSYHDTTLTFSAITSRAVILLSLKGVHGAGDYALSTTTPMKTLSFGVLGPPVASWGVDAADAGTVHITSLTATRIKGTLTATLQPGIGTVAAAPLVVTCTFDLGMAQLPAPH
jgi:hypothetical protein